RTPELFAAGPQPDGAQGTSSRPRRNRYGPPVSEPARWGRRRNLLDLMDRVHLARPAVQAYELALAVKSKGTSRTEEAGGLPLPPARLRAQIGPSHADARVFLESGRIHAELIQSLLRDAGTPVEQLGAILDWGCGCGRVLRHWSDLPRTLVHGCDINPKMVDWCRDNLSFAEVAVTGLTPPLPYADSTFDLIYAFSVFTHLTEELQREWMEECR